MKAPVPRARMQSRDIAHPPSWALPLRGRDPAEILYPGQLSAVLSVKDLPMRLVWTQAMWRQLLDALAAGHNVAPSDYPGAQADLQLSLEGRLLSSDTAMVVGSVSPWIEAILHQRRCKRIVSIDLHPAVSEIDGVRSVDYRALARSSAGPADILIAYSTVEHIGLGRYGDAEDPEGDVKWMRDFARPNLRPGRHFLLAVPLGERDSTCGAHRIYGPDRLARLLGGWTLVEAIFQSRRFDHVPFAEEFGGEDWQRQPVLVLRQAEE